MPLVYLFTDRWRVHRPAELTDGGGEEERHDTTQSKPAFAGRGRCVFQRWQRPSRKMGRVRAEASSVSMGESKRASSRGHRPDADSMAGADPTNVLVEFESPKIAVENAEVSRGT